MSVVDLTETGSGSGTDPRLMLQNVSRRLVELATVLEAQAPDEMHLRGAASQLDALSHRIRWVADVTRWSET